MLKNVYDVDDALVVVSIYNKIKLLWKIIKIKSNNIDRTNFYFIQYIMLHYNESNKTNHITNKKKTRKQFSLPDV